jgi:hypothetical protein
VFAGSGELVFVDSIRPDSKISAAFSTDKNLANLESEVVEMRLLCHTSPEFALHIFVEIFSIGEGIESCSHVLFTVKGEIFVTKSLNTSPRSGGSSSKHSSKSIKRADFRLDVESGDKEPSVFKIFTTSFSSLADRPCTEVSTEFTSAEVLVNFKLDIL